MRREHDLVVQFSAQLRGISLVAFRSAKVQGAMRVAIANALLASAGDDDRVALAHATELEGGTGGVEFRASVVLAANSQRAAVLERLHQAVDFTQPLVGSFVSGLEEENALPLATLRRIRLALVLPGRAFPVSTAAPTVPPTAPLRNLPQCSVDTATPAIACSGDMATPHMGVCDAAGRCQCRAPFQLSTNDGRCWKASDLHFNVADLISGLLSPGATQGGALPTPLVEHLRNTCVNVIDVCRSGTEGSRAVRINDVGHLTPVPVLKSLPKGDARGEYAFYV